MILPGIFTLIFTLTEIGNNFIDFSGDEIFLIYCSGSEKKTWFQHAICIPAIIWTWNAQILKNGQRATKCTAGKPPTLFYDWKWKKKSLMTQQVIPIANFYDFLPVLFSKSWLNIQKKSLLIHKPNHLKVLQIEQTTNTLLKESNVQKIPYHWVLIRPDH